MGCKYHGSFFSDEIKNEDQEISTSFFDKNKFFDGLLHEPYEIEHPIIAETEKEFYGHLGILSNAFEVP